VVVVLLPLPLALADPDDEAVGTVGLAAATGLLVVVDVTGDEPLETVVVAEVVVEVEAVFADGPG
jgi:hypothetical protein